METHSGAVIDRKSLILARESIYSQHAPDPTRTLTQYLAGRMGKHGVPVERTGYGPLVSCGPTVRRDRLGWARCGRRPHTTYHISGAGPAVDATGRRYSSPPVAWLEAVRGERPRCDRRGVTRQGSSKVHRQTSDGWGKRRWNRAASRGRGRGGGRERGRVHSSGEPVLRYGDPGAKGAHRYGRCECGATIELLRDSAQIFKSRMCRGRGK